MYRKSSDLQGCFIRNNINSPQCSFFNTIRNCVLCIGSEGDYSSTGFLKKSFTDREQGAIAESRKASISGTDGEGRSYLNYAGLNGEKIFLLDAKEATNLSYGYSREGTGANNRIKAGGDGYWWLRSANFDFNNYASIVDSDGELLQYMVNFDFFVGVSPTLNVDLSSVLFSSVLPEQNGNGGTSYKLTIHDSGMEIQPGGIGQITRTGDTIRIPYTISGEHGGNATNLSDQLYLSCYRKGQFNQHYKPREYYGCGKWNGKECGSTGIAESRYD